MENWPAPTRSTGHGARSTEKLISLSLIVIEHPLHAVLIRAHREVRAPEGVLRLHRGLAAGRERGEVFPHFVLGGAIDRDAEVVPFRERVTGHRVRGHQ